jgi:hypothetical protein
MRVVTLTVPNPNGFSNTTGSLHVDVTLEIWVTFPSSKCVNLSSFKKQNKSINSEKVNVKCKTETHNHF